jgi:hypothetical protein
MNEDVFQSVDRLTEEVLRPILAAWAERCPQGLVFALVAESECERLAVLQDACRTQGMTLVGGLFPGLVRGQQFVTQGAWLLCLPCNTPCVLIDRLNQDPTPAATRIAAALAPHLDSTTAPTLFLVFDASLPNIVSILDELYLELADGVRYLGVNAGSETFQPIPCLFDVERLIGDGMFGILLPAGWQTALVHGYRAPDEPIMATATQGNRIVSIDWQPAFPFYRAKVMERYGVSLDRENFYQYAVHFPFGISLANGEILVRIPVALDEEDGILCAGEVPGNTLLTLLQSPEVDSLETARSLAAGVRTGRPEQPLLLFYCAARRIHLGDGAEREMAACVREIGAALMGGTLSLGEIGSVGAGAYPVLHHAALVALRPPAGDQEPA